MGAAVRSAAAAPPADGSTPVAVCPPTPDVEEAFFHLETISRMIVIVMGVSGAGKTAVGKRLAGALGWDFIEGDDYHLPESVAKMQRGVPLTDEDRLPWLDALRDVIENYRTEGRSAVIACSALKQHYRQRLQRGDDDVHFIYLKGPFDLIRKRLQARRDHFFDADLLQSQFDALEEPDGVPAIDVSPGLDDIVRRIRDVLEV